MKSTRNWFVFGLPFALIMLLVPGRAAAEPGITVYPGMQIRQGHTTCTVGLVEPQLRIALTSLQCDGAAAVTDGRGQVVGTVILVHREAARVGDGSTSGPQFEVIELAKQVIANEQLPGGRQLQTTPQLRAQPGLPVCHLGGSNGQSCGHVTTVGENGFGISDLRVEAGDFGAPIYTLTDNHAVIIGLLEGVSGSTAQAASWQAVMRQLYLDARPSDPAESPIGVRTISSLTTQARPSR